MPIIEPVPKPNVQMKLLMSNLHSFEGKLAAKITELSGSMMFVYVHVLWFVFWISANHGLLSPLIPIFDPYPYGLLTMVVSLEAIFLSTFILVAQNRQAMIDKMRDIEEDIEDAESEKEFDDLQDDLEEIKRMTRHIKERISAHTHKIDSEAQLEKDK